ncbi:DUF2059 domain-containing protein [Oxalobacter paraformigenes]|uniref:DUF2059 domain-containing protein n=1 Tax=Oxalobacter paraformigenes TaxID=556268 RepID=C3X4U9_9BURK|nr:DUF2059 domain-containing protein [Oxalobacter paraformigenes]EEO28235.1 hypothetical protein OFAG_01388 [Oxalobacter paraformigenes]
MKRLLFILFATLFSLPAFASPAQDATIEKLLILTDAQKLSESAVSDSDELIETTLKPVLQLDNMSAEKKKVIEAFLDKYKNIVKEEFSWEKMVPDYIRIYRETFTEEELQSLIAFYESPAGQMFIRKTPEIMDKMSDLLRMKMVFILSRMNTALNETLKALPEDKPLPATKP